MSGKGFTAARPRESGDPDCKHGDPVLAARLNAPELCHATSHTRHHRATAVRGTASFHSLMPVIHADVKLANTRWKALRKHRCCVDARAEPGHDEGKNGKETSEAKRRQTQGSSAVPSGHGRASVKRDAHICRRSTAALTRETFVSKAQRQARLPGTRQERLIRNARSNPGSADLARLLRALPALACPSPAKHLAPQSLVSDSEVRTVARRALMRTSESKGHWRVKSARAAFGFEVPL